MITVDLYTVRTLHALQQERFASSDMLHQAEWRRQHAAKSAKHHRSFADLIAARAALAVRYFRIKSPA